MDPEVTEKIRYAKFKAADIAKALREGRVPEPGPPGGEPVNEPDDIGPPSDDTHVEAVQSPAKSPVATAPSPVVSHAPIVQTIPLHQETVRQGLSSQVVDQTTKHCKFVISALQYDDLPTAISNLEKALALLKSQQ